MPDYRSQSSVVVCFAFDLQRKRTGGTQTEMTVSVTRYHRHASNNSATLKNRACTGLRSERASRHHERVQVYANRRKNVHLHCRTCSRGRTSRCAKTRHHQHSPPHSAKPRHNHYLCLFTPTTFTPTPFTLTPFIQRLTTVNDYRAINDSR